MQPTTKLKWAKFTLFLAAVYNLFWGALISLKPDVILFGNAPLPYLLIILQCVGMLVGVYGIAYYYASRDPFKYWPLILVGFIGKALGPFGSLYYIWLGQLDPSFLWVNVFNDVIWLYPFGWVIYQAITGKLQCAVPQDAGKTLYQKFLGDAFNRMSPNLREFHGAKKRIRVLGKFEVTRGTSFMGRLFANMADLPQNNKTAEAELVVEPHPDKELWLRRLDDKQVLSKQWLYNGLLVERFKVINIHLCADVNNGDLIIYDVASTILGIAMPPFFTPTVLATGKDAGDGVAIEVEIGFRPFGRIINYKGVVSVRAD